MKVPKAVIRKKREIKVAENLPRYSIKENFADINSNILIALLLQASPKICNEFYKLLKNSEMKKEQVQYISSKTKKRTSYSPYIKVSELGTNFYTDYGFFNQRFGNILEQLSQNQKYIISYASQSQKSGKKLFSNAPEGTWKGSNNPADLISRNINEKDIIDKNKSKKALFLMQIKSYEDIKTHLKGEEIPRDLGQDNKLFIHDRKHGKRQVLNKENSLKIIQEVHNKNHVGMNNTWDTVKKNYSGPGMLYVVKRVVAVCDICQKFKEPVPNVPTEVIVKFLKEEVIANYGIPVKLITNIGRNFVSKEATQIYEEMGINHQPITAYRPQSIGQVERFI
ncbi:hypothetical protein BB559_005538 [Furculomyces boomerangus]|uniref:Integrase catalytic domain-containing protein n=1 Tax=Furculomyces boomerangus TaxID=61424 RepID=A0A2T9Y887_9FUNG|nr:hypothetical protein BB559_005538 [Furculomyces boomerangus]